MTIFIEPDRTQYPPDFEAIKCPGLEEMTGADMVIAQIPIPPTVNLSLHIKCHSLFVQIKIGYDICSFDQLHSSIARMQAARIPKGQAILLPIGDYWEDGSGLLRIKGKKAYSGIQYRYPVLGTIYDMWAFRGGTVEALPPKSIDDLQEWVDRKQASLEKIKNEGARDIYPPSPAFVPKDIWQAVEVVKDWRKFLVCGLDDFGSKKAQAVFDYAIEHTPDKEFGLYHVLCLITDEDEKGKPLHKIPLIGKGTRKQIRGVFGLSDGWNLPELAYRLAFYQGWRGFGDEFKRLVNEEGLLPKEVYEELMKENPYTDMESQIAF